MSTFITLEDILSQEESTPYYTYLKGVYDKLPMPKHERLYIDNKHQKIIGKFVDEIVGKPTVEEYFYKLWNAADMIPKKKEIAVDEIKLINTMLFSDLKRKKVYISEEQRDVSDIILKAAEKDNTDPEAVARKHRLKEALRRRQELEAKLTTLNADITILKSDELVPLNKVQSLKDLRDRSDPHQRARSLEKDPEATFKRVLQEKKVMLERKRKREEENKLREEKEMESAMKEYFIKQDQQKKDHSTKVKQIKEELKKKHEERQRKIDEGKERSAELHKEKPLYVVKLQQERKKDLDDLTKKKETLQKIRDLHRPIAREELDDFEKKFQEQLAKKEAERKEAWKARTSLDMKKPAYESRHHKIFQEETDHLRRLEEEKALERKELLNKRMKYAEAVKEQHPPVADPKKEAELKILVESLKTNPFKMKNALRSTTAEGDIADGPLDEAKRREVGNNYLEFAKSKKSNKRSHVTASVDNLNTSADNSRSIHILAGGKKKHSESVSFMKNGKIDGDSIKEEGTADVLATLKNEDKSALSGSTANTNNDSAKKKNHDYLDEIKKKFDLKADPLHQWQKIAKDDNLTGKEKKEKLKMQTDMLEEQVLRKEQLLKQKSKSTINANESAIVDEMYINVIKAKLAMIGEEVK